jgi:hypothetical protein
MNITKLCTTERGPWTANALREHVCRHLARYEYILMLRAIWEERVIHYQVLDVPVALLRLISQAEFAEVGHREGRRSLGGDVFVEGVRAFHVHFDGADGKCQIQRLPVSFCQTLAEWDYQISE